MRIYSAWLVQILICPFILPVFFVLLLITTAFADPVQGSPPEAIDVRNFYIQNISGRTQILPLVGRDSDGTITSFQIKTLPPASAGRLYLNNVAVSVNQQISPADAKRLQFEVKNTFSGTANFTYTVTDNQGLSDVTPATFTIPVTTDGTALVCSNGSLGANILGAAGTFSYPYIKPNPTINCINDGNIAAAPLGNLGNPNDALTKYIYASGPNQLGPEGTYSFLKTIGTIDPANRNCIKKDWVASDHTGDGGYAMIVNGSPNAASFGKTFYQATSIAVCPNTLYEFSAYVINVLPGNNIYAVAGSEPNISFYINDQLVSTSGAIAYSTSATGFVPQWVKVGGLWYSGPNTSVDLRIDNATFVASGNDLGLDDISLAICGPDIEYPEISLNPQYCSYGVLPLKASVKASINTYSSYIFQNSTDGGVTWTDLGNAKTASPVYNSQLNVFEYIAEYGDIPIDPSMNGYQYRLKVATESVNLAGTGCNISADKVITVNAFTMPDAGTDTEDCSGSTTTRLKPASTGEMWQAAAGNPAAAFIDAQGNVSGMDARGVYRFVLSNAAGCSDTVAVVRDQVKSAGSDVILCGPASTFKLPEAGQGYSWESITAGSQIHPASGQVTGMEADGIYQFILRSAFAGCADTVEIDRRSLKIAVSKTDISCFGSSSGAIDLEITGGSGPFTYQWSNGLQTQDLSSLSAGSYTVVVTDGKGCTATETVNITQPAASLSTGHSVINVNCFGGSTGAIDLSVSGGTAPYTFLWNNGSATEDVAGLAAGAYSVVITDSNGCTVTQSVSITQPTSPLAASFTQTNVNCYGESTGAIDLSVSGGTAPYTFLWSNGSTAEDLSGLAAGTYMVVISDANGCVLNESITISQPGAPLSASFIQTNVNCFSESTGAIDLSVSGGTAPYTFLWNSGSTTEDVSNLTAGTYTVVITDANGCVLNESITITQPAAPLSASFTQTNVNCFGESTGAIDLSVSGGTAPYTFLWSNGSVTEDVSGLAAGTYSVTITDANGCILNESTTITQPAAPLSASFTQTNVNCYGESTGAIDLSVSGGTAPYTFAWSTGETTEDVSSLVAGTYSVVITDANGCIVSQSVSITQPTSPLAASFTQTNVNCYGESTGAIDLFVSGGTAPYTFVWSNGSATEDVTSLAAGAYSVVISDANGCVLNESFTITEPVAPLSASLIQTNVNCFGESTGAIDLSVSGGTAPYTFAWSTGSTTEDVTSLAAGTYTVGITDANGCILNESITITQPTGPLLASFTQTNVTCFGGSTGAIDLSVSGGTAPYTFLWTNGSTAEDLSSLKAGTYTVAITDANGCILNESITITEPVAPLSASFTQTNVNCFGESTGAIDLSVSGGTAPYTFLWSNGSTTEDVTSLTAGAYSVVITDANGCVLNESITITEPVAPLSVSFTQTNVNCFGTSTGAIDLSVSGGTAPYTFAWSNGSTTEDVSTLVAGTYSIVITDANGCNVNESITITQPVAPLSASFTQTNVNCYGESTGDIDLSVSGGTAPYTFLWSNGSTAEDMSSLAAGTYTVAITDANGCVLNESITISQPGAPLSASFTQANVNCFGESTGAIDLSVSGGTAPYTFLWSNGSITEDVAGLAAGAYSVVITDANGCSLNESITITQPVAPLSASFTQTNVNCYGESTGAIDLSVSGGTAPYTFVWSNGSTTEDVTSLVAGTYSVTVTDANGCTLTQSVSITQPVSPLAASFIQTNINCYGESTGAIDLSVSGGTAPYTFAWSNGLATEDMTGLTAGTYSVTVTDANGCTVTQSVSITQPASPLAASFTQTNVNCYGESTGAANLSVSGGTAPYTFLWSNGSATEDVTGLAAGSYSVTVTDANGCTLNQSVSITQPASPLAVSFTQTNVNCYGESIGAIDLSVSGGTAPYTFLWSNGSTTEDVTGLTAGTYSVTVSDAKGCTLTQSVSITQPTSPLAASFTQTNVNCYGESTGAIDLSVSGGTAPYTFLWSNGSTAEDMSSLAAGTYTVAITDANGCVLNESITISQPGAPLSASFTQANVNCFGGTGAIDLSVSGGTAPYTFLWSNGSTTEDVTSLAAGTYSVTVTDANGCTVTQSVSITQPASPLAASFTQTNVTCFAESTGAIDLSVSGGTAPYTFLWNNGSATEDVAGLAAGAYSVVITDANGCSINKSITITQPVSPLLASFSQTNINCFGGSTGAVDLSVSGGTLPYTFLWSNGSTAEDLVNLTAGTYSFTVTDANGCSVSGSIVISQGSDLSVTSTWVNVSCKRGNDGLINISVTGGVAPYSYLWSNGARVEDINDLQAGTYTVTVIDALGCSTSHIVNITEPAEKLTLAYKSSDVQCHGAATGSINVTVSGGTAPYTLAWSDKKHSGPSLANLPAGKYVVTATDAKGCTSSIEIQIKEPPALVLNAVVTDVTCYGSATGAVDLAISGGKAPYTVRWSTGSTAEDVGFLAAGHYTVTVVDANGCSQSNVFIINQPKSPMTLSSEVVEIDCYGAASGSIKVTPSGGTGPYTYKWSDGSTTAQLSNMRSGIYTVVVRDSAGCTQSGTFELRQPQPLLISPTVQNISCSGSATGSVSIDVTGGTPPYRYEWGNGANTAAIHDLAAGEYSVKVTDAASCTIISTFSVSEPPPLRVSVAASGGDCLNASFVKAWIDGGEAPYKITWNNNPKLNALELTDIRAGTYSVQVVDTKGCIATASIVVLTKACPPEPLADRFSTNSGVPVTADVSVNDSPQPDLTFKVKNPIDPASGQLNFSPDGTFHFTPAEGFSGETGFTYTVCDASGTCADSDVKILVIQRPTVSLTPALSTVREGGKISVTAKLSHPFSEDVVITIAYSGTAERERDYLVLDNYERLRIPKGQLSTMDKLTIAALIDPFEEGEELIVMDIATVSNPSVIIGPGAKATITDVYPPPPPQDAPSAEPVNTDIVPDPLVSPNADGAGNDVFTIRNVELFPDNEVFIYNRWGNELFSMKNYNNSDRSFKGYANKGLLVNSGTPVVDGVYFYIIYTYVQEDGRRVRRLNKGYFILKR